MGHGNCFSFQPQFFFLFGKLANWWGFRRNQLSRRLPWVTSSWHHRGCCVGSLWLNYQFIFEKIVQKKKTFLKAKFSIIRNQSDRNTCRKKFWDIRTVLKYFLGFCIHCGLIFFFIWVCFIWNEVFTIMCNYFGKQKFDLIISQFDTLIIPEGNRWKETTVDPSAVKREAEEESKLCRLFHSFGSRLLATEAVIFKQTCP